MRARGSRRSHLAVATAVAVALGGGCARSSQPPPRPSTPAVPAVISETALSDRMHDLTISSPALGRAAWVRLLLPERYAAEPDRRWPVLYLLHGCCDPYGGWTAATDVVALSARSDLLVVLPEGGRIGFYSDWAIGDRWETFHLIGGLSMGGLGALGYAARHPGLFRAAASFSGIVHTRLSAARTEWYRQLVRREGADPDALWGDPHRNAEVWAAHNPYDLAPSLRGSTLFVSVGDGRPGPYDPPGTPVDEVEAALAAENAALIARLRALRIPVHVDFYGPGTHTAPYWQRELHRAWPLLQAALGISDWSPTRR
jgi:diacylglycerol O-acyltransferase/trehalose O-mycolyltransferase